MAISANTVWEFRSTATANMANGGGFNPSSSGTDYSQQDTAHSNGTDLATTTGTTAGGSTLTSASHTFTADEVGNMICISAGTSWTAGWYEIKSISAGAAVVDRAVGTVATLSAGTWAVGGSLNFGNATLDSSWGTGVGVVSGNSVWFKAGTFSPSTNVSWSAAGGLSTPITIRGYNTTRGDNPTGTSRPVMQMPAAGAWTTTGRGLIRDMIVQGANTTVCVMGSAATAYNCKFVNTSTSAGRFAVSTTVSSGLFANCEFISYRGVALRCQATNILIYGCYIHDSDIGVQFTVGGVMTACIVESCKTSAVDCSTGNGGWGQIIENTLFGGLTNKTGTGINITAGQHVVAMNNTISGFVTGIATTDTPSSDCYADFNNFFNCTTNKSAGLSLYGTGFNDTTLDPQFASVGQLTGTTATTSGSVLTDSSQNFSSVVDGQDFILVTSATGATLGQYPITSHTTTSVTSSLSFGTGSAVNYQVTTGRNYGNGRNLIGIGYPQSFPTGLTLSHPDIGGVQRAVDADYSDPGVGSVLQGTNYTFQNQAKAGTYQAPSTSNVKIGVAFGPAGGSTGTYDGSDRWSDPGVALVISPTAYKANSTSNNRAGTVVLPTTGQVKIGVAFGASSGSTGTYDGSDRFSDPLVANVRAGTNYQANSTVNNRTGTLDLPSVGNVKIGTTFDGSTKTGTYDGSDRYSDPDIINVRAGISYQFNSVSQNRTGVYDLKPVPQFYKHSLALDGSSFLNGAVWITLDGAIVPAGADLGNLAYRIYLPDGTDTGIGETGISASTSGLFFITPVDLTTLLGNANLIIKVTAVYKSATFIDYTAFSTKASSGGSTDLTPVQTVVNAIKAKTDNLPSDPASNTHVDTRLAASAYTAPDNTSVAAIKAKTDNLPADPASNTHVDTRLASSDYVAPDESSVLAAIAALPSPSTPSQVTSAANAILAAVAALPEPSTPSDVTAAQDAITTAIAAIPKNKPLKNQQLSNFEFMLFDSTGAPVTGKTPLIRRSIDGGALADCVNQPTEVGQGIYKVTIAAADLNGDVVAFRISATGTITRAFTVVTS